MKVNFNIKKMSLIRRILISIGIALFVFLFEVLGIFQVIDNYIFDLAYMQDNAIDLPITIIGIDDATLKALGNYQKNWTRKEYADLMEVLVTDDYAPAEIVFDVLFTGPLKSDRENDIRFAELCKKYGKCVFGIDLEYDESIITEESGAKRLDSANLKNVGEVYDEIAAFNPRVGYTNNDPVFDKYIRTFIPYFAGSYTEYDENNNEIERYYDGDSIDYAAYRFYMEQMGEDYVDFRQDRITQYRFSYSGSPGTFEIVSFLDVLNGKIPAKAFKDKIVYVGAYATAFGDAFLVPSDHTTPMYGVEVHANILEAIHDGAYQVDVDKTPLGIIYGILAGLLFFTMCFFSLQIDAVLGILFIAGNLLLGRILYENGLVIDQFAFFLAILSSYIGMVIHHYLKEGSAKRKLSKAFKMYVAPQIVEEVAGQGDFELNLGGRNKDIAVLFIDIRGFTTMSENLSPEEVVNILNEYFAVVTDAVFKNKGTIDKFIGDACMAVFNSPFDLDDYVYRAVHTGWDILQSGQQLQNTLMEKYGRTINFGIGVNCGEAVIGNIGCEFRMDYTAIGDTVNTSSRLESNAKAGQLLISEEVLRRLDGRLTVEEIGAIPLKGKSKSIMVYNVVGITEPDE
ncbi:MAG: adenylate/guanylate cyclase domain-containing protein [Lachnospiraceae bacterium]|nr:adenylate/guanylate cyclase domain-containing protein [Lachnospiraceae bacterium]MBR5368222.1 adenylate/guanylate cyclase domain-containing protein [Lachnospiraceae bacterium]